MPRERKTLPNIAVVGGNQASKEDQELAYDLGQILISRVNIICGGRQGIMRSVAEGASQSPQKQGSVLGILPSDASQEGNPFLDIALPTGLGVMRNTLIALSSDVMIAIGGQIGTLIETLLASHENKHIALLGKNGWTQEWKGMMPQWQSFQSVEAVSSWAFSKIFHE